MTHSVGDVKAEVVLVQAKGVVEIAADPAARQVEDRQAGARHLGHGLRQKTLLDSPSQLQLLIHFLMSGLQALIDQVHLGRLFQQPIVKLLNTQEGLHLRQQLARRVRPLKIAVHSRLQGVQPKGGLAFARQIKDRDEGVGELQTEATAEIQFFRTASLEQH